MAEYTAHSWNELNDLLYTGAWQEPLGRFRASEVFRGQSDTRTDLTTSLMRLGGEYWNLEGSLLRAFRRYAVRWAPSAGDGGTIWNWLALAQHHGLPTRMLDWSYSPYVALHFASCDLDLWDRDGSIWCIDFTQTNALLPTILKDILVAEGAGVFTTEMLSEAAATLPDFDRLAQDPFVVFLEPPSFDDRIVNQFALFALVSNVYTPLDEWIRSRAESAYRHIIVPAGLKPEIRDKLDQINMTERVLFPGLDGVSAWLRRYYSPRHTEKPSEK